MLIEEQKKESDLIRDEDEEIMIDGENFQIDELLQEEFR